MEQPEDIREKLIDFSKRLRLSQFRNKNTYIKSYTVTTDEKSREKLMVEKVLELPKTAEQIKQKTFPRENKKIHIESTYFTKTKEFEHKPVHNKIDPGKL